MAHDFRIVFPLKSFLNMANSKICYHGIIEALIINVRLSTDLDYSYVRFNPDIGYIASRHGILILFLTLKVNVVNSLKNFFSAGTSYEYNLRKFYAQ